MYVLTQANQMLIGMKMEDTMELALQVAATQPTATVEPTPEPEPEVAEEEPAPEA